MRGRTQHRIKAYSERRDELLNKLQNYDPNAPHAALDSRWNAVEAAIKRGESRDSIEKFFDRFRAGADVQNRATARQAKHALMRKTAANVLKVAQDYGEVNYSELALLIKSGDIGGAYNEAKNLAKSVANVKKQETALGVLIPDVHNWHKVATMEELNAVYNAVESKLAQWASFTLEQQAKKLHFEAYDFLGGNKNNVQTKYPNTWKISQSAYIKKLNDVNNLLELKAAKLKLKEMFQYSKEHPNAKVFAKIVADMKNLISSKADIATIKKEMAIASSEYKKRLSADATRASKKANKNNVKFDDDAYSAERKDAALWSTKKDALGLYDKKNGDAYFRPFAEKDWAKWSENERDVAYLYTSGSSYINEPLYTTYYGTKKGLKGEIRDSWADINTLTKMIDESTPFTRDVWLNRGASAGEFMGQFGLDLNNYTSDTSGLIGVCGEQKPFMSTAHSKSWGFVDNGGTATARVVYNIYCPKGTKGIYTEPYSAYGNGGRGWDGIAKAPLGNELEVILQRGTKLRVTKAECKNGQWFIDMEIIEQPSKLPHQP